MSYRDLREWLGQVESLGELKTVEGADLTFAEKDGKLWIWDAKGDSAQVTIRNVMQSNGVIHVIDTVLLPG